MLHSRLILAIIPLLAASGGPGALAGGSADVSQRDCTPFNGRYGYYGNLWCDPPSLTSTRQRRSVNEPDAPTAKDGRPKKLLQR